jgi:hypothetical protein
LADKPPPPWSIEFFRDPRGKYPVAEFIRSQADPRIRAKIVRKIEHLAHFHRQDLKRPLVDTLKGAVKELVVDKQVRVLFSCEDEEGVMLMLEADRKKNGDVNPKVVEQALGNREKWLDMRSSDPLERIKRVLRFK